MKECFLTRPVWRAGCHLLLLVLPLQAAAQPPAARVPVKETIPYGKKAIDYFGKPSADPIAKLAKRIESGDAKLTYRPRQGYLLALLQALDIPLESQVLVFSKTSVNRQFISPKSPRALYFNDDTYVGWTPGAAALEISAVDPQQGTYFYELPQKKDKPPRFERRQNCLTCHANSNSLQVPGQLLRSFVTDARGEPTAAGRGRITHDVPLAERWGGWYVTGRHGKQTHRGNIFGIDAVRQHRDDPSLGGNVTDLDPYCDVEKYPRPHSDVVALMVLDHQSHIHNLLTRLSYETRLGNTPTVENQLLRYLFFVDEPPLTDEILGTSGFTETFEFLGPEDSKGRSLRQFDLRTRLFKYRLSYQVYSRQFSKLPQPAKDRLLKRIWNVLAGTEQDVAFQKIPQRERQAILEILRETQKGLPAYFRE